MLIFREASSVKHFLQTGLTHNARIGFIPTMGALHEGHISLMETAKMQGCFTVCSIFVNPTQFNNREDFEKYPISIEKDIELLLSAQCDLLFLPSADEIYPAHWSKEHYDLGHLETVLEGVYRPGHFQGVCQVVDRLLDIVQPHMLFLGEKDFQQCMVLKRLLELKPQHRTQLQILPTKREPDGLAMSSRNRRLNEDARKNAVAIYQTLQQIKLGYRKKTNEDLIGAATTLLHAGGFVVDYVSIADATTLSPATAQTNEAVALVAASLGGVRLIDNMQL